MSELLSTIIPIDFGSLMLWTMVWCGIVGWLAYRIGKLNGEMETSKRILQ